MTRPYAYVIWTNLRKGTSEGRDVHTHYELLSLLGYLLKHGGGINEVTIRPISAPGGDLNNLGFTGTERTP